MIQPGPNNNPRDGSPGIVLPLIREAIGWIVVRVNAEIWHETILPTFLFPLTDMDRAQGSLRLSSSARPLLIGDALSYLVFQCT